MEELGEKKVLRNSYSESRITKKHISGISKGGRGANFSLGGGKKDATGRMASSNIGRVFQETQW